MAENWSIFVVIENEFSRHLNTGYHYFVRSVGDPSISSGDYRL